MTPDLPLRDIQLPDPVSWWPPAPGWWASLVLGVGLLALLAYGLYRLYRRRRLYRMARHEFSMIVSDFQSHQDSLLLSQQLSGLLRRTAISVQPRTLAAGLTGENWLLHLDRLAGKTLFNNALGQQLISTPYQASPALDSETLISHSRIWIECVSKRGRHA